MEFENYDPSKVEIVANSKLSEIRELDRETGMNFMVQEYNNLVKQYNNL